MPRGATVVYPKDAAQIVAMADIFPGARVIEAGAGSGALTCSLLRAVGDDGVRLVVRAPRGVRRGRASQRRAVLRRGRRRPGGSPSATSPMLQATLSPTGSSSTCSRRGRSLETPSRRRWCPAACCAPMSRRPLSCRAIVEALREHGGFAEPQPWESMVRGWHVDGLAVRPEHRMIGHTGFLVTARRLAPGVTAPPRRRRPCEGARDPRTLHATREGRLMPVSALSLGYRLSP